DDTADTGPAPISDSDWQSSLFSDSVIHEITITIPDDGWTALTNDPYDYTPADATFDGEAISDVGLRLRGKVGSFRPITGKPKFKFDFEEYVSGQELHGLKALALNNEVVDCSYLKEPIGYRIFRDAGLPASRTGFAHLTVNGMDYGLYVIVEYP